MSKERCYKCKYWLKETESCNHLIRTGFRRTAVGDTCMSYSAKTKGIWRGTTTGTSKQFPEQFGSIKDELTASISM